MKPINKIMSSSKLIQVILLILLSLLYNSVYGMQTAGWVEQARLISPGFDLKAKLDTGAENTSINALDMEFFVTEGEEHVRFKVKNKIGKTVELVRPVIRYAKIKRHFTEPQKRPVVRLVICIGDIQKEAEVSLVDREKFKYSLLIGRSYLAGDFLIDSGNTFLLPPQCGVEAR